MCASYRPRRGISKATTIPDSWTVRATAYGPSTSTTWSLPASGVVFVRWGGTPGQPYVGVGPTGWAHTTARLGSEVERSLADEAAGPLAQLLAVPQDGGNPDDDDDGDGDGDAFAGLRSDIARARGRALLLETTAAGWGEGRASAPQRDWQAAHASGQTPPAVPGTEVGRDAFARDPGRLRIHRPACSPTAPTAPPSARP